MKKKKRGSIIRIVRGREFGFIQPSDNTGHVLFHFDSIENVEPDALTAGQKVRFELIPDDIQENRIRAINVRVG